MLSKRTIWRNQHWFLWNMIKQQNNEIVQSNMKKMNNINILQIYFFYELILKQICLHVFKPSIWFKNFIVAKLYHWFYVHCTQKDSKVHYFWFFLRIYKTMLVVLKKISIILQFKSIEAKTYYILRAKRFAFFLT